MISARGTRSAVEVWEDYARIARWTTWSPQLLRVRAGTGRIATGTRGTVNFVPFTITAVDEPAMTWTWRVAGIELHHAVRATPSGCVTTFDGPLPYLPFAWIALRRLVSGRRQQPGDRLHG
ncbi:polyketide cyclase [Kineococcus rhizosphaerae]|uniref:Polyketide cyclase/dehydrase/lipid transport protein n=1 Tax=Kineococcus rhizosphaerae TaxID=559628 RepID=A0A2T0RAU4_9ACTN|nr:polyketide cyclase [Kineococcus rhizosphaerae]PRY18260.1 hypothetical protein CLV37_101505 [Kineococcus rhizosphaerae]